MSRVLIVHNNYGKYSGEEAVVDKMAAMLKQHGHIVGFYRKTTEGVRESFVGKIKGFFSGMYCPSGVRGMKKAINDFRPDVVNVHNLYPFITPAALFECKKAGVPVVMTIHNYRLICPTGLFMRNVKPCELCLEKGSEWSCIRYNCENSLFKSIGYTLRNVIARKNGAFKECVTKFVCITEFQKRKLVEYGFDNDRIEVIPNFIETIDSETNIKKGEYVAYSGRLSSEKGVDLILEVARRHPEIKFRFAGELRDKSIVASGISENCEFLGYLSGQKLIDFYEQSKFIVMASRWYEGFPMTILETAVYKKPVIAPDHGGFTEIIGSGDDSIGRLFVPGNIDSLEQNIVELWNNERLLTGLGEKAFQKLNNEYSSDVIYQKWEKCLMDLCK